MFSLTAFTQLNSSNIYPHANRSSPALENLIKTQTIVREKCCQAKLLIANCTFGTTAMFSSVYSTVNPRYALHYITCTVKYNAGNRNLSRSNAKSRWKFAVSN